MMFLEAKIFFVALLMVWIYDEWTPLLNHEAVTKGHRKKSLVIAAEAGSTFYRVFLFSSFDGVIISESAVWSCVNNLIEIPHVLVGRMFVKCRITQILLYITS